MRNRFAKWVAALLAAALLLSPVALMEGDAVIEAPEAVEAVDAEVGEAEAELGGADLSIDETGFASGADYLGGDTSFEADAGDEGAYFYTGDPLVDSDTLFGGYVDQLFGVNVPLVFEARNLGAGLTGDAKKLYDTMKPIILDIAAGKRSSTELTYTADTDITAQDVSGVINTLIADYPYEMYWYGNSFYYRHAGLEWAIGLTVSADYAASGQFLFNTATASKAAAAASNARAVVSRYSTLANYDKLVAYRDYICDSVTYNDDAASSTWDTKRKDPWQIIWVFDGDPSTNVVCEGYAKAFQYLCDMSTFSGKVVCYCVTGRGNGVLHKWNIVHMPNGKNYHVDTTFADQDDVSMREWLFMKAPSQFLTHGYSYNLPYNNSATYQFDNACLSLYTTADLTVSPLNYGDEATPSIIVTRNRKANVSLGSKSQIELAGKVGLQFKSSKKKIATVSGTGLITAKSVGTTKITFKVGKKTRTLTLTVVDPTVPTKVTLSLSGTVAAKVGDSVTLTATLPEGTKSGIKWESSDKKVATVSSSGVVKFKKAGKVTITATAKRGKKKAKVKFKVSK